MADFEIKDGVAIIPEGTEHIDEFFFEGVDGLTTVVIPKSVVKIHWQSCLQQSGVTKIIVEEGNERYDSRNNCNAIIETESNTLVVGCASTVIPDTVEEIGKCAFYNCSGLTSVVIPNSVTSIGDSAFCSCRGLTSVHIDDIAAWCNIEFNGSLANPLYYAKNLYLNGEKVTELVIPNSVTSIGEYAFYNCSGLTSVEIPNSVTSIGEAAFRDCSGLTSLVIGNGVTSIGKYAFFNCSGLTSVEIPNSVTSIGEHAFRTCSGLTSVVIGNGVTRIEENATVTSIGSCAFMGCTNLASVHISDIAAWCKITFDGSKSNPLHCAHHLYKDGNEITNLEIPEGVTVISESAFTDCENLTSVTIPEGVTSIGESAFTGCSALTTVTLPKGVKKMPYAFFNCTGITTINIPAKKTDYYKKRLPENLHQFIVEMEPVKKAKKK